MNKDFTADLVDSHCHIDFPDFDSDLDQVIVRAEREGISKILTICTSPQNLEKVSHQK